MKRKLSLVACEEHDRRFQTIWFLRPNMTLSFETISARFETIRMEEGTPHTWESPYRLLGGAAYSIGCALAASNLVGHSSVPDQLPPSWWKLVRSQVESGSPITENERWIHIWSASYMLTNAMFRIAAATEKVLSLVSNRPNNGRSTFGDLRNSGSTISQRVPTAHKYLNMLPSSEGNLREEFLRQARASFNGGDVGGALACIFMQTDEDKHVPYKPLKQLPFEFAMTTQGFVQACEIFDEAITGRTGRERIVDTLE